MILIIGLGNPGTDYINTRHNAGHIFIDELSKEIRNSKYQTLNKSKILIFKSQNFMNESGIPVKKFVEQYKVDSKNLFIVHDDLDIKLGEYKIQFGRGPKDHNGLKSIDQELRTNQYWHVRVGVDNRPLDNKPLGEEYVLQNFSDDEKEILIKTIKEACRKLINNLQLTINN